MTGTDVRYPDWDGHSSRLSLLGLDEHDELAALAERRGDRILAAGRCLTHPSAAPHREVEVVPDADPGRPPLTGLPTAALPPDPTPDWDGSTPLPAGDLPSAVSSLTGLARRLGDTVIDEDRLDFDVEPETVRGPLGAKREWLAQTGYLMVLRSGLLIAHPTQGTFRLMVDPGEGEQALHEFGHVATEANHAPLFSIAAEGLETVTDAIAAQPTVRRLRRMETELTAVPGRPSHSGPDWYMRKAVAKQRATGRFL